MTIQELVNQLPKSFLTGDQIVSGKIREIQIAVKHLYLSSVGAIYLVMIDGGAESSRPLVQEMAEYLGTPLELDIITIPQINLELFLAYWYSQAEDRPAHQPDFENKPTLENLVVENLKIPILFRLNTGLVGDN